MTAGAKIIGCPAWIIVLFSVSSVCSVVKHSWYWLFRCSALALRGRLLAVLNIGYFVVLWLFLGYWIFSRLAGSRECGTDIGYFPPPTSLGYFPSFCFPFDIGYSVLDIGYFPT
jgi:hypothetical protein